MLTRATLYFLTFPELSHALRSIIAGVYCKTVPLLPADGPCTVCLWPRVLRWGRQSVLFPRGNHEWYEPTGDLHSLPPSGFSVDMTHLLPKRSELESTAIFQGFHMDSIDSISDSWNGFPQPLNHSLRTAWTTRIWPVQWKSFIVKAFTLYYSTGGVDWEK